MQTICNNEFIFIMSIVTILFDFITTAIFTLRLINVDILERIYFDVRECGVSLLRSLIIFYNINRQSLIDA